MSKLIKIFLLFVIILSPLQNPIFASGPESLILGNSEGSTAKEPPQIMETPDPTALKLNWWEYFDVKNPPEFAQRIQAESQLLYSQLSRLSGKDLELATSLINNILMHLNAILAAKQQPLNRFYPLTRSISKSSLTTKLNSSLSTKKMMKKTLRI